MSPAPRRRRSPGRGARRSPSAAKRSGPRHGGPGDPGTAGERLQKALARAGLASRREAEEWIRGGRLTVNGRAAVLGQRVVPADELRLDGRLIPQRTPPAARGHSFLLHRSPGESLVGAAPDPTAEPADPGAAASPALLERLPRRAGRRFLTVSPMPRIDGGLELATSDGELAARLQRAVRQLECEFSVRLRGELGPEQLAGVLAGTLDSGERLTVTRCEAAGGEGSNRWYAFAARGASGKSVRQLFERQGALVSRVLRTRLGPLALERALARGAFRELTAEELSGLLAAADSRKSDP